MADIFDKISFVNDKQAQLHEAGLYPYFLPVESAQGPVVTFNGKECIMAGSNNYLGLANDERMKEASINAIKKYGTGCAGSRLLNGNTVIHEELENKLAKFKHHEAALIYSAGYQMNVGVVSCLLGKKDIAIVDKLDHASILDGVRMSGAEMKRFKHNDMQDLERILSEIGPDRGKLVIVDGVFSMEGDICNLPEVVKLTKKYNARLIVDDAHATGVLGPGGRGSSEYFGLTNNDVDLVTGTCSKSFASVGGFVVGKKDIIRYIQHSSRSMIFSAALPVGCVASISKAIDIIESEPQRIAKLWENAKYLKKSFEDLGYDVGKTQTPIIPVIVGDDEVGFKVWRAMLEAGIFTNPVISPAVPPGGALMRATVMATHEKEHIDKIVETFDFYAPKLGVRKKVTK